MKTIPPLIHADPERSVDGSFFLLAGSTSGYTADQIRAGHNLVTPVLNARGDLETLEIQAGAGVTDICAVLYSCGIPIQAITGMTTLDAFGRPVRYTVVSDMEIGPGAYTLVPIPGQDIIDS